ncbi:hypothetical protein HG531_012041 [Fusarium graminearum]|nr:hypothetical protein HG531_012041 [Fusarium graminearum]
MTSSADHPKNLVNSASKRPSNPLFMLAPLVLFLDHINEAGLFEEVLVLRSEINGAPSFSAGFNTQLAGTDKGAVWEESVIITGDGVGEILHFEIATRLEVSA